MFLQVFEALSQQHPGWSVVQSEDEPNDEHWCQTKLLVFNPRKCTVAHVPTSIQVPVGVFQQQPALVEQSGKVPNVEH